MPKNVTMPSATAEVDRIINRYADEDGWWFTDKQLAEEIADIQRRTLLAASFTVQHPKCKPGCAREVKRLANAL